ncbi:hypothetical protein MNBD_BACTEROID05-327, partial [hydrothermal vent metagenome]
MKKIIVSILLLSLVGSAGFYAYLYFMKEGESLKAIAPQGAIGYVQFSDIEKNVEYVKETQLWQDLKKIDYDVILQKSDLTSAQRIFYQFFKEQVIPNTENPIVENFFSRDTALVIYPISLSSLEMSQLSPQNANAIIARLFSGLMLFTRVDPKVKFVDLFTSFLERFTNDISVSKEKYKNKTIHLISVEQIGLTFGLVRVDDVFVIGLGQQRIKEAIDVLKKDAPSLTEDPNFKKISESFVSQSGFEMAFDLEKFFILFEEQAKKIMQLNKEASGGTAKKIDEFFKGVTGLKGIGISSALGTIDQIKMDVFFDEKQLNTTMKQYLASCSSSENKTIAFVPQDVLGYQWTGCFDLLAYWDQVRGEMDQAKEGSRVQENFSAFEAKM